MILSTLSLCLVTQPEHQSLEQYLQFIAQAIKGGVTSIQLRDKTNTPSVVKASALALKSLLTPLKIPLIINDYVDLAKEIEADGVHLGQSDCSPINARTILGPNKIIGWSIESYVELNKANQLQCIDYIAASAVFPSKTKKDCKTIWGLEGLKQLSQHSKHPIVAIGGVNVSNVREVIAHGACGVAVVSAINEHEKPFMAAKELIQEIKQGKHDV